MTTLVAGYTFAATIALPSGTLTIPGTSTTGVSFTYPGTLTQADTLAFGLTGTPCLQASGTAFCTNGAGILTVASNPAGTSVGGAGVFTLASPVGIVPAGTWTFGSLLIQISGVDTKQIFPANAANGLGSATPPTNLTLPSVPLSALGFAAFSQANPTITFIVTDTAFADNGGHFILQQAAPSAPIPTLNQWGLLGIGLLLAIAGATLLRRKAG